MSPCMMVHPTALTLSAIYAKVLRRFRVLVILNQITQPLRPIGGNMDNKIVNVVFYFTSGESQKVNMFKKQWKQIKNIIMNDGMTSISMSPKLGINFSQVTHYTTDLED